MDIEKIFKANMKREQSEKIAKYNVLNTFAQKGKILFTGSSLMEQFPINELLTTAGMKQIVYNRGVGGFTTDDMLKYMDTQIFDVEPSKIFINIGTNDISNPSVSFETALTHMLCNYTEILTQIQTRLPKTDVYLMAYYPVNETDKVPDGEWGKTLFVNRNNHNIPIANTEIQKLAKTFGFHYINVNAGLTDERDMLKKEYTVEGVHMYANAYQIILKNMKPYL